MSMDKSFKDKKLMFASWGCKIKDHYHYTEWIPFFKDFFGKLVIFSPRDFYYKYGKERMNKEFLSIISGQKPDYLLLSLSYDEFYIETLKKIKQLSPKTVIINFFGDDDWRYEDWSRFYAPFFDYNLVTEKDFSEYKKDGVMNTFYIHGSSPKEFAPQNLDKKYDVAFIGAPVSDRSDFIRFLRRKGINVTVGGKGWEKYPDLKPISLGYLNQEEYKKILNQAKINLSFSKGALPGSKGGQSKGRVFEIMASKSFGLIEATGRNIGFFIKNKKLTFRTKEELLSKIRYFLSKEKDRRHYSELGYKDFIKNHTWESQFEKFFFQIKKSKQAPAKPDILSTAGEILVLSDKELFSENLKDIVRGYEFISFNFGECYSDKDRNKIQIYSLLKSKKSISCCDYVLNKKGLGEYMQFTSKKAYHSISKEDFSRLADLRQLLVRKEYFLANINSFRASFKKGKIGFMNDNNSVFVSIPLINITDDKKASFDSMEKAFIMKFRDRLFSLLSTKDILWNSYSYNLLISSFTDAFPLRYIYESIIKKEIIPSIKRKISI